jgi:molybdenum cofactor synthesis domain-containing protein
MTNDANYSAAIIIIGNEILSGRTQDCNATYIAEKLGHHGITLEEARVIPDQEARIIEAVNELRARHRYVFTTGGIGPTHDDITADSIAKAFGVKIDIHDEAFRLLEKHYGIEELTPPRAKMARIPHGAQLIPNPVSAAPGFIIGNVYVMAGVPRIMQAMFDNVLVNLEGGKPVLTVTVSCALPESEMAEDMSMIQQEFPAVSIGSYPHFRAGVLGLSIVIRSSDKGLLDDVAEKLAKAVRVKDDEPLIISQAV